MYYVIHYKSYNVGTPPLVAVEYRLASKRLLIATIKGLCIEMHYIF